MRKTNQVLKGMVAGLTVLAVHTASAAVITWEAPTELGSLSDFNVEGYSVEAINVGGQRTISTVERGDIVFAGAEAGILANGSFNPNNDGGAGGPNLDTGDAGLNSLLNVSDWQSGAATITIGNRSGGLRPGSRYIVQFFAIDTRGCCSGRTVTFGDGNGNDQSFSLGAGGATAFTETLVGRFVANDFTQTITISGSAHPYLAAYSLQSVAKFVPEPSTVSMLGLGLGLIAVSRRKLHKYKG